jgi:four helix bundle protein
MTKSKVKGQKAKGQNAEGGRMIDLDGRLLDFATTTLKLSNRLSRTPAGRYLSGQLMRSSASAGANYQEACGAESRADFVHKLQRVLKELRESGYWVRLIARSGLVSEGGLSELLDEAQQLVKILAKSVVTAKSRAR